MWLLEITMFASRPLTGIEGLWQQDWLCLQSCSPPLPGRWVLPAPRCSHVWHMSGLSRNNLPKEAKAKAASESSFTSSYCVSVLQRGMNLFKKLLKTSGSPPPWRMWHVSGGAQGAEEALSRAVCLSSAASELGEQNHCNAELKLLVSMSAAPPQGFPGTGEKLVRPGCGYLLNAVSLLVPRRMHPFTKGFLAGRWHRQPAPREAVRQGKLQGEEMNRREVEGQRISTRINLGSWERLLGARGILQH